MIQRTIRVTIADLTMCMSFSIISLARSRERLVSLHKQYSRINIWKLDAEMCYTLLNWWLLSNGLGIDSFVITIE